MQNRRVITVVVGAMLCLGAIAVAQDNPRTVQADKLVVGPKQQTTLIGNVVLTVNGVVVRADRAVIQGTEVTLEGNVRLTLPKPIDTAAALRQPPPPSPVVVPTPHMVETIRIDPPIPPAWQPPPSNQRPLPH